MDSHALEYFQEQSETFPKSRFHKVIPLHDLERGDWDLISSLVPSMPRGWFELAFLKVGDRLEFLCEHWLARLPFFPHTSQGIEFFFNRLDDIGIYITQETYESGYNAQMVYSLKNNAGFFHGKPPMTEANRIRLQEDFPNIILPADYQAFLQIHDGFSKYSDTGITPSYQMLNSFNQFQKYLDESDPLVTASGSTVNPKSLIPFYESFGLRCYQCFWSDWYPEEEMGNVYYSGIEKSMCDPQGKGSWQEKLTFPTFLDWLAFYLEGIE